MAYDRIIGSVLRSIPKPVEDLRWSLVEYPDGLLTIRVYENQIMALNDGQREDVLRYLEQLKRTIVQMGHRSGLEGVKGDPPGRFV